MNKLIFNNKQIRYFFFKFYLLYLGASSPETTSVMLIGVFQNFAYPGAITIGMFSLTSYMLVSTIFHS